MPRCRTRYPESYRRYRWHAVLPLRLYRALFFPYASLAWLWFATPSEAPSEVSRYIWRQLLACSHAFVAMAHTFMHPVSFALELLLAPTKLMLLLPLNYSRLPVALSNPQLQQPVCAIFSAVYKYSVEWMPLAAPQPDAHRTCMELGPSPLSLLLAVFIGCIFPLLAKYAVEAQWRRCFLGSQPVHAAASARLRIHPLQALMVVAVLWAATGQLALMGVMAAADTRLSAGV